MGTRGGSARPSAAHAKGRTNKARGGFSTSAPRDTRSRFGSFGGSKPTYPTMQPTGSTDDSDGATLITRRNLVIGAVAIGAVAAVGAGASYALNSTGSGGNDTVDTISVAESDVVDQSSYTLAENADDYVSAGPTYKLPYGTLVWADDDKIAACLLPTDQASPLATIGVLNLKTGNNPTLISEAQGAKEGFDIVDVRANADGLVWVESNPYTEWRVYTARLSGAKADGIQQTDSGTSDWLIPSLAVSGSNAFWQSSPKEGGGAADQRAVVRSCTFGSTQANEILSSKRAFACRLASADDGVVAVPRAEATGTYFTVTKVRADGSVIDSMTLPASMTPDLVAYGRDGFSFGFSSIYNYGGGIANLGTYTPRSKVQVNQYNGLPWFRFSRSPLSSPCWCGDWFIVKSTTALCGVNMDSSTYFTIKTMSGSDDYGEQLVSSGTRKTFVGLSQIKPTKTGDRSTGHALVRTFSIK